MSESLHTLILVYLKAFMKLCICEPPLYLTPCIHDSHNNLFPVYLNPCVPKSSYGYLYHFMPKSLNTLIPCIPELQCQVTEIVLCEDKTLSTGLKISDHDILVTPP